MTADDDGRAGPRFEGFHAYADDTPRVDAFADRLADAPAEIPSTRQRGRPWGKMTAAAGVVLAVAVGLWLGLSSEQPEDAALRRAAAERPSSAPIPALNVEVASARPPPAAPPPSPADRLEVLPPAGALAAGAASPPVRTDPPVVAEAAPVAEPSAAPPRPKPAQVLELPRDVAAAAPARDAAAAASAPPASLDCRDAPSRASAMVCGDLGLAALDRRMKRAYAAALGAGLPEEALRQDQDDWLDIREDAARYSRAAVANVYRQRIAELERAADEGH